MVMDNIRKLVEAAGSNMDCLIKTNVWLRDQSQAEEFEQIYRRYFSTPDMLPARARLQAGRTPMDCGLEIEAIAYIPPKE
jgi:2-iminobutanoate/2-iminopropanoate deaminase